MDRALLVADVFRGGDVHFLLDALLLLRADFVALEHYQRARYVSQCAVDEEQGGRRKGRTEGELLERAPGGLGEEEPDEDDFEEEEDAVADVILPACCVGRVNVSFSLEPARTG